MSDSTVRSPTNKVSTMSQYLISNDLFENAAEEKSSPIFYDTLVFDPRHRLENTSFNRYPSTSIATVGIGISESHHIERPYDFMSECNSVWKVNDFQINNREYPYTCFLVFVRCVKAVFRRLAYVYLDSSIFLALIPLLIGLGLGISIGRYCWPWLHRDVTGNEKESESKHQSGRISRNSKNGMIKKEQLYDKECVSRTTSEKEKKKVKGEQITSWFKEEELQSIYCHNDDQHRSNMEKCLLEEDIERDESARSMLRSDKGSNRESGVPLSQIPGHLAVIMDGNRRYGRAKYGSATRGHWDGSKTLVEFAKWCIVEGVQVLTVYAFSTENWSRHPSEVKALMAIFCKYCDELRIEALASGIRLNVLSTDTEKVKICHFL